MTDPERLLDEGATQLELELLRAGDADGPSTRAQHTALAALGLGGAVLTTSSTAAAGAATVGTGSALLKWWALGALAVAAVGGSAGYLAVSTPSGKPSAPLTPNSPSKPIGTPAASDPVTEAPPADPPPDVQPSAGPRVVSPGARSPTPASSTILQEQIALIDRARTAAAAGNPAATLAALDEYSRKFPKGSLYQEATMLRIEALLARGDKASAQEIGRRFLSSHPRSALAPRVRQLLGD